MTYEEILSHFQVKKYGNGKVQALCPAHPDKEASLTITQGNNGRTLLKCHAGCSSESVVLAAGLKMADLFSESRPAEECWRMYIESREKRKIEAVYNYVSINGEYAYTKIRLEGKKMLCAHVPVAWIRISPPKQYTEEQRQQMGERMRRNVSENKGVQE